MLPFWTGGSSMMLVLERNFIAGRGGLPWALLVVDRFFSVETCSACASRAADSSRASSLRSCVQDFVRGLGARASTGNTPTVALCGIVGRFDDRGDTECPLMLAAAGANSRLPASGRSFPSLLCEMERFGLVGFDGGNGGLGEMGTFHITASSGTSSSESWYSASNSFTVLRFGCHDCLRP